MYRFLLVGVTAIYEHDGNQHSTQLAGGPSVQLTELPLGRIWQTNLWLFLGGKRATINGWEDADVSRTVPSNHTIVRPADFLIHGIS